MITWHAHHAPAHPTIAAAATDRVPQCAALDEPQRARYLQLVDRFARRLRWEAAYGFTVTDAMVGTIAGHVALMALGLDAEVFRHVRTVVVHPSTMVLTGARPGPSRYTWTDDPLRVSGHTTATGPVFISWDVAAAQAAHPEQGRNVIFHEFAHRLDVLDGTFDGTPPLPGHRRHRWIRICQAELDLLRSGAGSPLLRPYAATNPAEFFAVATELFFDLPAALRADRPNLYAVLADYYRQDPADLDPAPARGAAG